MAAANAELLGCDSPPAATYDVALLDLDGVVYVGREAVPSAASALAAAGQAGMRIEFVTNNALRTPEQVAARLRGLGIDAATEAVVTSAQAAARLLTEQCGARARVLVTGGEGLHVAVAEAGLQAVDSADEDPDAVVVGYDPSLDYARLAEAALAVRRGARFVACNRDATMPTERGPMAGMGALAAFVEIAGGRAPLVAGKPEPALHRESVRRSGARRPLVVGDRLETDIEGARRAGTPSLLVLTGVTDLRALAAASRTCRPDLVSRDLNGLLTPHAGAAHGRCGHARAEVEDGRVQVRAGSGFDVVRAGITAAWACVDSGGDPPDVADLGPFAAAEPEDGSETPPSVATD
ncbi:MAG: HAD-IIA family hydrolase [Mycobacteriales bacterium]